MGLLSTLLVIISGLLGAAGPGPPGAGSALPTVNPTRDDTASLQARLDQGGELVLPRLPDGSCYQTHGLWVSLDNTSIVSDGACIVGLGPGPARLTSNDGDPIPSDAIVYVNRSSLLNAAPHHVRISGLRLIVPQGVQMDGIEIDATDVELDHVSVEGFPIDSVDVGGRQNGDGYSSAVSIHDSSFTAGARNVVSVTAVRGISIERCLLSGASDTNYLPEAGRAFGNPSAGIDVEPNTPGDAIVEVTISRNRIEQNAGPGILLALNPTGGDPAEATRISILGNRIVGNGTKPTPPIQGGIVVEGGQADGKGTLQITGNVITGNQGSGLQGGKVDGTTMVVDAHDNDLTGNSAGPTSFLRLGSGSRLG